MIPSYVKSWFTKSFFTALKDMARHNTLNDYVDNGRSFGSIFLPFNDHFLIMFMFIKCRNITRSNIHLKRHQLH